MLHYLSLLKAELVQRLPQSQPFRTRITRKISLIYNLGNLNNYSPEEDYRTVLQDSISNWPQQSIMPSCIAQHSIIFSKLGQMLPYYRKNY